MSDYLWDKTGEADADVERLENLLGTLGHQPRPLELPREAPPARVIVEHRRFRPALAVAAALLLMLLAGALVVTMRRESGQGETAAVTNGPDATKRQTPDGGANAPNDARPTEVEGKRNVEQVAAVASGDGAGGGNVGGGHVVRQPGRFGRRAGARNADSTGRQEVRFVNASGTRARTETVVPTKREQQLAKEQLMFALRLTSAKFAEVRKKTEDSDDAKPAFEERNKTR
ncbi:MAG TPA: hypothetical protein VM934_14460 [Pyrinomonadaceae bacterium]|nr:hypothetical protein [Pyrinomonadaceae bacterium]